MPVKFASVVARFQNFAAAVVAVAAAAAAVAAEHLVASHCPPPPHRLHLRRQVLAAQN